MPKGKTADKNPFSPQYFIINKSEPKYDLIKKQLLDSSRAPPGASCYFIRADEDRGCICRIRAGNGTVLFYEILNHQLEGISENDIREALSDPANAAPLAGYYYVTPKIGEHLAGVTSNNTAGYGIRGGEPNTA